MKSVSFSGGLKLPVSKDSQPPAPETLPAPENLIFPLQQHAGSACTPVVNKGDVVHRGQMIAQGPQKVLISSVSGQIEDIKHTCLLPDGSSTPAIRILNDGRDTLLGGRDPSLKAVGKIYQSGINDFSPRSLPLFTKLAQAQEKGIHTLIINGLDEASVLGGQSALLQTKAQDVLAGGQILQELFRAEQVLIAVYAQAEQAVTALEEHLDSDLIRVVPCRAKHPQHKDQLLLSALLGQEYPPETAPEDMGITVVSAECAYAVAQSVVHDQPYVHKLLTIHGPDPAASRVVFARQGTSVQEVLGLLGLDQAKLGKAILGGPLTGWATPSLDLPVTQQIHTLCLQTRSAIHRPRDSVCCKCGYCVQVCPMRLMPFLISGFSESNQMELAFKYDIFSCIECGCCAYVCPVEIPLVQWIQMGKSALAQTS